MMHGMLIGEYIEKVLTDSVPKGTVKLDEYINLLKKDSKLKSINLDVELSKAHSWILAHPGRKLTKAFFNSWIQRALTNEGQNMSLPSPQIDVEKIFDRVIQLASRGMTSLPDTTPEYVRQATRECGGLASIGRLPQSQIKSLKGKYITILLRAYNEHQQRNNNGTHRTRTESK